MSNSIDEQGYTTMDSDEVDWEHTDCTCGKCGRVRVLPPNRPGDVVVTEAGQPVCGKCQQGLKPGDVKPRARARNLPVTKVL